MITHSVIFSLKHPRHSAEEKHFFDRAKQLSAIPGVQQFECLEQFNPKNKFAFGLSMVFENETVYAEYNSHPAHVAFIQECWLNDVTDFLEIDYKAMP